MNRRPLARRLFDHLACGQAGPVCSGLLTYRPDDFLVDEILGFEPEAEGERPLVRVPNTGADSEPAT